MCDFSLCIGCPFDDPDFGCLRSSGDVCRLVDVGSQISDDSASTGSDEEVSS